MTSKLVVMLVALLVTPLFLASGCGDPDGDENLNTSEYIIPEGAQRFVTDEEIAFFLEHGFNLYEGERPPGIEGVYLMADSVVTFDESNEHTGRGLIDYEWTFSNQVGDAVEVSYISGPTDTASGIGGFISGDGDCFTVMSRLENTVEGECPYTRIHMFSGCVVPGGIDNFETAYITRYHTSNVEGMDCDEYEGPRRLSVEQDGLIPRIDE